MDTPSRMREARRQSTYSVNICDAWRTLLAGQTVAYTSRGMVGVSGDPWPEEWKQGDSVHMPLMLWRIPLWTHVLRIAELDPVERRIATHEHGAFIVSWRHEMRLIQNDDGTVTLNERIAQDSGLLTPIVNLYTSLLLNVRQRRLERLFCSG
jgi:ligand-binding SRPBCC domain-containing protein